MKYHILSIGISKHQNPEANLQFASKDAADFFALFTQNVSNIGYKKLLTDNEATLSSIQTALGSELQNQVGAELLKISMTRNINSSKTRYRCLK